MNPITSMVSGHGPFAAVAPTRAPEASPTTSPALPERRDDHLAEFRGSQAKKLEIRPLQSPKSQQQYQGVRVLQVACPPVVNFEGTKFIGNAVQMTYTLPDQHVELVGGAVVVPYEVKLPQRIFDVKPGTITVTTEHGVEIRPKIVVTPDIINIPPAHVEDHRQGIHVAGPEVECETCESPAQQQKAPVQGQQGSDKK